MRGVAIWLAAGGLALLAACTPTPPARDKAYYAAHTGERAQEVAACQADPGRLGATANCVNAQAADADARTAHFYDTPKPASRVDKPGQL